MTLSSKQGFGQSSRLALAVALAIPGAVALPVVAQAQEAAQDINIAAGDLGRALQRYSAATGVQLVYSSDLVAGKRSPGVSGRMSPQQALGQLLAGTGLSARVQGNTATLVQAEASGDVAAAEGERLLGPVRVEGSQGGSYQAPVRGEGIAQLGGIRGGQDEEAVGYRAKVASITTGAPIALEDIPRMVTVQTQEQIEKQDITTLNEALERMPGITVQDRGSQAEPVIFSRGYNIEQYQIEGGPARSLAIPGSAFQNLDAFERVELLRGPNALTTGEGSPGGTINLVRKRPGPVQAISVKAEAGGYSRYGLVGDFSTPSIFGSPLAFRGVASFRNEGSELDNFNQRNFLLSGLFDMPLGEDARLEFGVSHSRAKIKGADIGELRYFDGPLVMLPRSFNIIDKSLGSRTNSTEIFSKLYVDIAQNWDIELGTFYSMSSRTARTAFAQLFLVSSIGPDDVYRNGSITNGQIRGIKSNQFGIDAKIAGNFETFGIKHDVFMNISYNERPISNFNGEIPIDYSVATISSYNDVLNPVYVPTSGSVVLPSIYSGRIDRNLSLVVGDTISWRDLVSLTALVRKDVVRNDFVAIDGAPDGSASGFRYSNRSTVADGGTWRPTFSATIKPTNNLTIFGTYADGFNRQDDLYARSGEAPNFTYAPLAPAKYQNKEIGFKYATEKWLLSLSAYRMNERGRGFRTGIVQCPPENLQGPLRSQCYTPLDSSRSKGFEAEFNGELMDGLSVAANFNYARNKDIPQLDEQIPFPENDELAKKSASVFVDWKPSFLKNSSLQIGAKYRGRIFENGFRNYVDENGQDIECPVDSTGAPNCYFAFDEKSYVTFDIGFDYDISENLKMRLFVENLTNKTYLSTISSESTGSFYGRPRTFMASLTWSRVGRALENGRSPTNGLAPFGDPSDWYTGFGLGYSIVPAIRATAEGKAQDGVSPVVWDFHTKERPTQLLNIGYRLSDNFRVELEGARRSSPFGKIGGNAVAPFGVCGVANAQFSQAPFNCDDVSGDVESWSLMTNVVYDFGKRDAVFRPYLGGGFGISRYTVGFQGKMDGIGGTEPWSPLRNYCSVASPCNFAFLNEARERAEFVGGRDNSASFALQAIAGASVKLNDRLELDLGYRYFSVPSMKWRAYSLDRPTVALDIDALGFVTVNPLTPPVGRFKGNYAAHNLTVGIRWALGGRRN